MSDQHNHENLRISGRYFPEEIYTIWFPFSDANKYLSLFRVQFVFRVSIYSPSVFCNTFQFYRAVCEMNSKHVNKNDWVSMDERRLLPMLLHGILIRQKIN